MSTLSIKTQGSTKTWAQCNSVLPPEIWQIILERLSVQDLCHICCVCRAWRDLVSCIDTSRWKTLYLQCKEWKHPNWPLEVDTEPSSWKQAYQSQYLSSLFWKNGSKDMEYMTCMTVLKRTKVKKVINVGPGKEHESLRSALAVANDYDQIRVHPGIYDEQFEMSSKIPFEMVGCGEIGSVILVVCIEQIATTGRLSNLVLRAPWFTSFILKIRSGFMQIDNCILEDGMIYVQNPGSCHVRFSSFRHAAVILQHVNASVIENCEFTQSDTADIVVEGHIKDEKNWTYSYLNRITEKYVALQQTSDFDDAKSSSEISMGTIANVQDIKQNAEIGACNDNTYVKTESEALNVKMKSVNEWVQKSTTDNVSKECSLVTDDSMSTLSEISQALIDDLDYLDNNSISDPESRRPNHASSISSSDESVSIIHSDSDDDMSDGSVIVLPYLRQKPPQVYEPNRKTEHTERHNKPIKFNITKQKQSCDWKSIDSNTPIKFDLTKSVSATVMLQQVKGCLIHYCRMTHSKGGIMVSLQGEATITACDISNVSYGIRCIQNAQVVILKNKIHHCRTSGIFMRLASTGLIAGNDIYGNLEAGIDIRKNADPIIQHNRIHNGKRSGIVILGSGRGLIQSNDIYNNKEAGVYILYGANPTITGNSIHNGQAAGIAVNEGGKGVITDNVIHSNQWGGIDIRHDANPIVSNNTIINGVGDGVVIGDKGVGCLEHNTISGNAGCGVWVMNANKPYLHGNQISCNGDCGIMMVDKSDLLHEGTKWSMTVYTVKSNQSNKDMEKELTNQNDSTIIQYNNIFQNHGKGMSVQHCDSVVIQYNVININQSDGVLVDQKSTVAILNNNINNNKGSGIVTSHTGSVDISGNGIYDNQDYGILCSNTASISCNDVVGNRNGGISLHGCISVSVIKNRVQSSVVPVIKIDQVKNGVIENNRIYDTEVNNKLVLTGSYKSTKENDSMKKEEKKFDRREFLKEPPARPHIKPATEKTRVPACYMSTISRVTVPAIDVCPQGSRICTLL